MQLYFQMVSDILITSVAGEIDHHSAALIRTETDRTLDAFFGKHLILDLEKVSFMDSSGIGVIMGRYKKVKEKGGEVYVTGCSEYVQKILEMAGVFTLLGRENSKDDAICSIQGKNPVQTNLEVM